MHQMTLNFDFSFEGMLLVHFYELFFIEDFKSNDKFCFLLSCQVNMSKLTSTHRFANFEVINWPFFWIEHSFFRLHIYSLIESIAVSNWNWKWSRRLRRIIVKPLHIHVKFCFTLGFLFFLRGFWLMDGLLRLFWAATLFNFRLCNLIKT